MGLFDWMNMGLGADPNNLDLIQGAPNASFDDRFGAARRQGVPSMAQNLSPISPEALAANAAARGIPPPPVDFTPPVINPTEPHRLSGPDAMDRWRQDADVGQALTGANPPSAGPPPTDIRTDTQRSVENANASTTGPQGKQPLGALAEALRGVKMPADPTIQRLGTPAAPRISTAIKGGDLVALLQLLNAAPGAGGMKLPSTLGQALGKG